MTNDGPRPPSEVPARASATHEGGADGFGDDAPIAPRPRAGFRSRPDRPGLDKAQLFAGVLRAGLGAVGVFGALLYLPIQQVTPVLAGVSILMMVTGSTATWRAVRDTPSLRRLPLVVAGCCAAATLTTMVMAWMLGAGSLGPVAAARAAAARERAEAPSIRFQPAP